MGRIGIWIIWITLAASSVSEAQYAYLSTLNYNNLAISRLKNLPNINPNTFSNYINPTYDQQRHRYIFIGQGTNTTAYTLFTLDAATGSIINNPGCYIGTSAAAMAALQYDNGTDTLYAIYFDDNKQFYFTWVDQVTGAVHIKEHLGGQWYYNETTFDTKDNLFIMTDGNNMVVIEASSGAIVYSYTFGNFISNVLFDDLTGKLYGFGPVINQQLIPFDSITLATGALHQMKVQTNIGFPVIHSDAIDQQAGKYIFVGITSFSSSCSADSLYVLDINTGSVLSRVPYPYVQLPVQTNEYVINFVVDNSTSALYTTDWHPPTARSITIRASANPACAGAPDIFTATAINNDAAVGYQWQLNGIDVGTNDSVYSNSGLATGDTVRCYMTSVSSCSISDLILSNELGVKVIPANPTSVNITAAPAIVCSGDTVIFTASPFNAGAAPDYQWQINGSNAGSNKNSFRTSTLQDGDIVDCIMTGSIACSAPDTSNALTMTVKPGATVNIATDTVVVSPGRGAPLYPVVTGTIATYQWTPATGLNVPSIPAPYASPVTTTTYRLTVTADDGCKASAQTTVLVYYTVRMPGAFTPNGDGKNDVFRIPASTPQKIRSFSIYNRWGQQIFRTANAGTGWDGTFGNQPQPAGSYVWEIEYIDLVTGKPTLANGVVLLVR